MSAGGSKIYTRGGDRGRTALLFGGRVDKDDPRVWAYGALDEVHAHLGMARALTDVERTRSVLIQLEKDLLVIGAELATAPDEMYRVKKRIGPKEVKKLESWIDDWNRIFGLPDHFLVFGRNSAGAALHVARSVCRRCERHVTGLARESDTHQTVLIYLNRLSDLLFVLAWAEDVLCVAGRVLGELGLECGGEVGYEPVAFSRGQAFISGSRTPVPGPGSAHGDRLGG